MCRGVGSFGVLFKADPEPPDVGAGNWTAIIERDWGSFIDPPPSTQLQLVTSTYSDSSLFSWHNQRRRTQFVQILKRIFYSSCCRIVRAATLPWILSHTWTSGHWITFAEVLKPVGGRIPPGWNLLLEESKDQPLWNEMGCKGTKWRRFFFFLCSMAVWFSLSCSQGRIHPKNKQMKAMCILCLSTQHWMKRPLLLHYLVVTMERWSGESQERQR